MLVWFNSDRIEVGERKLRLKYSAIAHSRMKDTIKPFSFRKAKTFFLGEETATLMMHTFRLHHGTERRIRAPRAA